MWNDVLNTTYILYLCYLSLYNKKILQIKINKPINKGNLIFFTFFENKKSCNYFNIYFTKSYFSY